MNNTLIVKVKGGHLVATISQDPNYPGIDVEYVAENDKGENLSRPRVLVEWPHCNTLRALIWNDLNSEDYTEEITLI
jgi:hypothetical protein